MISATVTFKPRSDLGRFVETKITPAVRMAVEESCALIQQRAQEFVPVDTGALQASITTEVVELGKTIRGRVGSALHYAPYVEFGTGLAGASSAGAGVGPYSATWPGMPAQPWLRPAFEVSKAAVKDIFAHDVALAVSK